MCQQRLYAILAYLQGIKNPPAVPVSKVAFQKHVANLGLEARIGGAPVSQFGTESLGDVNGRGF